MHIRLNSDGTWDEIGDDSSGGCGGCLLIILIIMFASGAFDRCSCMRCSDDTSRSSTEQVLRNSVIGHTTVNVKLANLRIGPGTNYDFYTHSNGKKVQIGKGSLVDVVEDKNGWLKIVAPDGGAAYIKKSLCTKVRYISEDKDDGLNEPENAVSEKVDEPDNATSNEVDANDGIAEVAANPTSTSPKKEVNAPIVETRQRSLINAKLGDVIYESGTLKATILVRTMLVRRQFRIKAYSAKIADGEYIKVSDVSVSGLNKAKHIDCYEITDRDCAFITFVIPQMPETGIIEELWVQMELSGAQEWVSVKNVRW